MTEKKLYTCDICKTDYANKADAQNAKKNIVNVQVLLILESMRIRNIRTKSKLHFLMVQNIGTDNS